MGGSHIATITGCFDHLVKWYRSIERSDNGPVFVAPITLPFVQIPFPLITYLVLDNVFTCPDNAISWPDNPVFLLTVSITFNPSRVQSHYPITFFDWGR